VTVQAPDELDFAVPSMTRPGRLFSKNQADREFSKRLVERAAP
jgi:hypothetical protein